MIYPIWRLSENHGRQSRPRRYGRTVCCSAAFRWSSDATDALSSRELSEIARLVKYLFPNGIAVDRLLPGLRLVASALNANDQAGARIAAVHLRIPDLPSSAARDAMIAEDALIKYERGDWNPDLHPRAGTAPNPGWFATTQGQQQDRPPTRS